MEIPFPLEALHYYYITGSTYNINPIRSYSLIKKIDLNLSEKWMRAYVLNSGGLNLIQFNSSSLILNSSNNTRPVLIRVDTSGNLIWSMSYSSPSFSYTPINICLDKYLNIQKVGNINSTIAYTEILLLVHR